MKKNAEEMLDNYAMMEKEAGAFDILKNFMISSALIGGPTALTTKQVQQGRDYDQFNQQAELYQKAKAEELKTLQTMSPQERALHKNVRARGALSPEQIKSIPLINDYQDINRYQRQQANILKNNFKNIFEKNPSLDPRYLAKAHELESLKGHLQRLGVKYNMRYSSPISKFSILKRK